MITLRKKLTLIILATLGLLIGSSGVAIYYSAYNSLLRQFDNALLAKAEAIMSVTEQSGSRIELEFSDEIMQNYGKDGTDYFELFSSDGRSIERSQSLGKYHFPLRYGTYNKPELWDISLPKGRPGRAIGLMFSPQGNPDKKAKQEKVILIVASDRIALDKTLATLRFLLVGFGSGLLALTAVIVPAILRSGLKPLNKLAEYAANLDAANLSMRFPTEKLPGELAPIVARLNESLARLEESFERERRFSSYVAHELRTPVAELRSLAELAIKAPEECPKDFNNQVLEIALQLESIITQLLMLARIERKDYKPMPEKIELRVMVNDILERFAQKIESKRLVFIQDIKEGTEILTDRTAIKSILTNLIENSIEYAPDGDRIEVRAITSDSGFKIEVINTAPELEKSDIPRLFDLFWRKDKARSASGHIGLGLSLARGFAHSVGCELSATLSDDSRLTIALWKN